MKYTDNPPSGWHALTPPKHVNHHGELGCGALGRNVAVCTINRHAQRAAFESYEWRKAALRREGMPSLIHPILIKPPLGLSANSRG